ncbi:hypothetical protein BC938DRAFT_483316 [Jimgerdemannia flammicorona]|uniref:Uncharacterized protein n=1 Tax=Jimgerdemannia flammicorona TaxID=994334 RepID=A0A433QC59_9FUNG|nr:hypothetical protein BC938DRAFT_483316 [Jimgerdemannia flammicorona]
MRPRASSPSLTAVSPRSFSSSSSSSSGSRHTPRPSASRATYRKTSRLASLRSRLMMSAQPPGRPAAVPYMDLYADNSRCYDFTRPDRDRVYGFDERYHLGPTLLNATAGMSSSYAFTSASFEHPPTQPSPPKS